MRFLSCKVTVKLLIFSTFLTVACKKPEKDPVGALNSLVKEYGFIGYQNPLENTKSGTLLAGRPTALSFVAHHQDCFPEEEINRYYDNSNFEKSYSYTFLGNLGFLASGNPIVSAGLGIQNDYFVEVKLSGISIEYMSSIDVTRWYMEGMDDVCKDYLDDVGFIIQSISTDKLTISLRDSRGTQINLDADNISQYFKLSFGVDYSIVDTYNLEITTPKYIGYQLGRLRLGDDGRSLFRAMSTKDDKFVFEKISLFDDSEVVKDFTKMSKEKSRSGSIDEHAIY